MKEAQSEPRIAPLTLAEFLAVQQSLNVLATDARNPELYGAWLRFGGAVSSGRLAPRDREPIVLRTAWRCGCEYELAQHAGFAREAGLTGEEIRRVAKGP